MNIPLASKLLAPILAWVLVTPLLSVEAAETRGILSVTLEKTLQFQDPEGEKILVPQGTYSVKAGEDQIRLESKEGTTFDLDAVEGEHAIEVPFPMVIMPSGTELNLPDTDLLVVLYPDGHNLQATGKEPQIVSRAIPENMEEFLSYTEPEIISLDQPAYFTGTDGSPMLVESGTYTTEVAQSWIRLIPDNNRQKALLLEATTGTHDTGIEDLVALSIPGGAIQEIDVHQIMLLLPTGETLEATGSYSGIKKRGWFKKKPRKKRAKKRRNLLRNFGKKFKNSKTNRFLKKAGKHVKKGVKKGWSKTKWAAAQAKKGIVKGAQATWKGMKWVGKKGTVFACKVMFKAPEGLAKIIGGPMKWVKGKVKQVRKDSKLINKIATEVEKFRQKQQQFMDNAIKSALQLNQPAVLTKLKPFSTPDGLCERGIPALTKTVAGIAKPQNQVRSRGISWPFHTKSIGVQFAGTYKIGGFEGGAGAGWDNKITKGYWFAGGTAQLPQLSGKFLVQFGAWRSLDNLKGGFLAAGFTIPLKKWAKVAGWIPGEQGVPPYKGGGGAEANITVDFYFAFKPKLHIVGIVVSPGVSAGLANSFQGAGPLGRITIQFGGGGYLKT